MKTLTIGMHSVEVEDIEISGEVPARELTARCGETTVTMRHIFGALDGPRPQVTVEQLQADLDAARQRVAEEAAWREELHEKLAQLK